VDFKKGISNEYFNIPCPGCQSIIRVKGSQMLHNATVKCHGCGADVKLDSGKAKQNLDGMSRKLDQSIKNIFKGLK
jgi:predicted Zn finger-like uncharacterized protein